MLHRGANSKMEKYLNKDLKTSQEDPSEVKS
jgi:hypothetical protein